MPGMELTRKPAGYCGGGESFWHEERRSARRTGSDLPKLTHAWKDLGI